MLNENVCAAGSAKAPPSELLRPFPGGMRRSAKVLYWKAGNGVLVAVGVLKEGAEKVWAHAC